MAQQSELLGMHDAARKVLAGKGKKLKVSEAHVRHAKNGGYIIRHDLRDKNGSPPQDGQRDSEEYTAANEAEMLDHMRQHMGQSQQPSQGQPDDEEDEEDEEENG